MADLINVAFIVCIITTILGSVALFLRKRKQTRLFFGIALLSLLIVVALMVALSVSSGA